MTYSTLLNSESINSQYLVIIKPRRTISTWTLISGTKYSSSFDYGEIVTLKKDGAEQTNASDSDLLDGVWYYDTTAEILYVDWSSDPNNDFVTAVFELYFGTFDAHWHRVPTNSSTRTVYYEPLITRSPSIGSSSSDILFGFLPTTSTIISLSNATHFFEYYIYDSSFNRADVLIYHYLDDLDTDNVQLIFDGLCKQIGYSDNDVTISIYDRTDIFDIEYRNSVGNNFYSSSDFTLLDPNYENRAIRNVYGVVDGFVPVNIDYEIEAPTTSNNRTWICIANETNLGTVTTTVPASPVSTATRTYVNSVTGLRVGDGVFLDKSGAGSDDYAIITALGSNYIDHTTVSNVSDSTTTVKRNWVSRIDILQSGVIFTAIYDRDFTEYTDATNKVAGFTFKSTLESGLSMSTLTPSDTVFCRIYGHTKSGSNSTITGNLAKGTEILEDLITEVTSNIDSADFVILKANIADLVGFTIPALSNSNFPTYKELLIDLSKTLLLKIYLNNDLQWTASQSAPIVSADKTIEDEEITTGSFEYSLEYRELVSKVIVEYGFREVSATGTPQNSYHTASSTSDIAIYLHEIDKQKTFESLHFQSSEASALADRLKYVFGDRLGTAKIRTENRFFDTLLSDVITVTRENLPGLPGSRNFVVTSTNKSLRSITIELDDQKGIEDNSGSW